MKRNNIFGVWHRCRTCGTVFAELPELREHMQTHSGKQHEFVPERESTIEHSQEALGDTSWNTPRRLASAPTR